MTDQPTATPPVRMVCGTCGSTDVSSDAVARWNQDKQDWELSGLLDSETCNACDEEVRLIAEEITPEPPTPYAAPVADYPARFDHLEIRPCYRIDDDNVASLPSWDAFEAHIAEHGEDSIIHWTLYGIRTDMLAYAIGDFTTFAAAEACMNAIMAPMAKARDMIRDDQQADKAANDLEDFVMQCSNIACL